MTLQAPTDVSASKVSSQPAKLVQILMSAWKYPISAATTARTCGAPTGATAGRGTSSLATAGVVLILTSARRITGAWVSATMSRAATGVAVLMDTSKPLVS